jgi:hypothetical protein
MSQLSIRVQRALLIIFSDLGVIVYSVEVKNHNNQIKIPISLSQNSFKPNLKYLSLIVTVVLLAKQAKHSFINKAIALRELELLSQFLRIMIVYDRSCKLGPLHKSSPIKLRVLEAVPVVLRS